MRPGSPVVFRASGASLEGITVDFNRATVPLQRIVFSCKFEGIRELDKKTVMLSLRRRLSRKECRIDGNSVQLGHSQLGAIVPFFRPLPISHRDAPWLSPLKKHDSSPATESSRLKLSASSSVADLCDVKNGIPSIGRPTAT